MMAALPLDPPFTDPASMTLATRPDLNAAHAIMFPMTEAEARQLVTDIRANLSTLGQKLLELYEREGWQALGYTSWRDCVTSEFDFSQSRAYQLLDFARVERNLSTNGGNVVPPANERQARPLAQLSTAEQQAEAWQKAIELSEEGAEGSFSAPTAALVQQAVEIVKRAGLTVVAAPDAPEDAPAKPHVTRNSGQNEWYTPAVLIDAARRAMGRISLDPASSAIANALVQADAFYTMDDNGLAQEWRGDVWLNPPYSQPAIGNFANKVMQEVQAGHIEQICILVNNATETAWFRMFLGIANAVCLLRGRVKFLDAQLTPANTPLQGQIVLYAGANVAGFTDCFAQLGAILYVR